MSQGREQPFGGRFNPSKPVRIRKNAEMFAMNKTHRGEGWLKGDCGWLHENLIHLDVEIRGIVLNAEEARELADWLNASAAQLESKGG
jgi:hypothetical protein